MNPLILGALALGWIFRDQLFGSNGNGNGANGNGNGVAANGNGVAANGNGANGVAAPQHAQTPSPANGNGAAKSTNPFRDAEGKFVCPDESTIMHRDHAGNYSCIPKDSYMGKLRVRDMENPGQVIFD